MPAPAISPETARALDRVEAAVAARLAPSAEFLERVVRVRAELVQRVEAAARERGSPLVRALVAGSAARGTFLADRLDIDLFLLFPPDLSRERLREEGLALGHAVLAEPRLRYAEHPYLRGRYDLFDVDAVPGYAVDDPSRPISPVDRTPYHQAYLSERETPETVREIRLTKQFLRRLGIYGSEARTEGLSGYLVELLVLRFGSLRALLHAARHWRIPVRLAEPGREPPRLPEEVALILADPVDPNRNVASALSRRNLGTLILAAGAYLDAPSEAWFEPRPAPAFGRAQAEAQLRERDSHVVVVTLPRPDLVDDTLFPQVRKAERAIAQELVRLGFERLGSAAGTDPEKVYLLFEVAHRNRAAVRRQDGPPAGIDRVGQFLGKWTEPGAPVLQGPYVQEDGSLAVEARVPERHVEDVLRSVLPRLSLGKDLSPSRPEGSDVRPLRDVPDAPAIAEALRALLGKRLPWLEPGAPPP